MALPSCLQEKHLRNEILRLALPSARGFHFSKFASSSLPCMNTHLAVIVRNEIIAECP